MRSHLVAAVTLGLLAGACQPSEQARSPSSPQAQAQGYIPNYTNATQLCTDYGFSPGTPAFERCASRERAARAAGRVSRDYAEARLTDDARTACTSYGLPSTSPRYETCVTREVDARRYQGS